MRTIKNLKHIKIVDPIESWGCYFFCLIISSVNIEKDSDKVKNLYNKNIPKSFITVLYDGNNLNNKRIIKERIEGGI